MYLLVQDVEIVVRVLFWGENNFQYTFSLCGGCYKGLEWK